MLLENKVALVTGAASGLGAAFVTELLKHDLKGLVVADIDITKGQELIEILEEQYGPNKVIFCKLDVTDEKEFSGVFKKAIEKFGNVDIVINSAGHVFEQNMSSLVDVNLKGVINGTLLGMDEYLPKYRSSEESVIVNISSVYGLDACGCFPIYSATKFGVVGFGEAISAPHHYETTKVKILTICPGYTQTAIIDRLDCKARPGRYQDILEEVSKDVEYIQKPEIVAVYLIQILKGEFKSGEIWIIEDDEAHQVELPKRTALTKLRTLKF